MSVCVLLHKSYYGSEVLETLMRGSFFWTMAGLLAVSAGLSLVRVPKEKGSRGQGEQASSSGWTGQ